MWGTWAWADNMSLRKRKVETNTQPTTRTEEALDLIFGEKQHKHQSTLVQNNAMITIKHHEGDQEVV
jgi:hypothetical protein